MKNENGLYQSDYVSLLSSPRPPSAHKINPNPLAQSFTVQNVLAFKCPPNPVPVDSPKFLHLLSQRSSAHSVPLASKDSPLGELLHILQDPA